MEPFMANHDTLSSPNKHHCLFTDITNPYECHTIHRDVKELRSDYKEILKSIAQLEKSIAINTTKSAVISSLITTMMCGILVGLGTKVITALGAF